MNLLRFINTLFLCAIITAATNVTLLAEVTQNRVVLSTADQKAFETMVQHLCAQAQDAIVRFDTLRYTSNEPTILTDATKKAAKEAEFFLRYIPLIRDWYVNNSNQERAIQKFLELTAPICSRLKLKSFYIFEYALPTSNSSLSRNLSHAQKIARVLGDHFDQLCNPQGTTTQKLAHFMEKHPLTGAAINKTLEMVRDWAPMIIKGAGYYFASSWAEAISGTIISGYLNGTFTNPFREQIPLDKKVVLKNRQLDGSLAQILEPIPVLGYAYKELGKTVCGEQCTKLWDYWAHNIACPANESICYQAAQIKTDYTSLLSNSLWSVRFLFPIFIANKIAEQCKSIKPIEIGSSIPESFDKPLLAIPSRVTLKDIVGHHTIAKDGALTSRSIAIMLNALKHPFAFEAPKGSISLAVHGSKGFVTKNIADMIAHTTNTPLIRIQTSELLKDTQALCKTYITAAQTVARGTKNQTVLVHLIDNAEVFSVNNTSLSAVRHELIHMITTLYNGNPYYRIFFVITSMHDDIHEDLQKNTTFDIHIKKPNEVERKAILLKNISDCPSGLLEHLLDMTNNQSHEEIEQFAKRGNMIKTLYRLPNIKSKDIPEAPIGYLDNFQQPLLTY